MKHMKPPRVAFAVLLVALLWLAPAVAAENGTDANVTPVSDANITPVSVTQNATISVPVDPVGLTKIGVFENASVYVSGGANATITGDRLAVDIGAAAWMEYRDVYLLYRLPAGFRSFSFDYDLAAGEKSNVLLVDFYNGTPLVGTPKGGIPDTSVLGLGTWTSRGYDIGGISGLKPFPPGAHHVDVFPSGDFLCMRLDGSANLTAFDYYAPEKYLLLHLMVGDENSYLRGTLSGLACEGPAPGDPGYPTPGHPTGFPVVPGTGLNGSKNGTASPTFVPGRDPDSGGATQGRSQPLSGLNLWLAIAAGAAFLVAWAVVYYKYLNK